MATADLTQYTVLDIESVAGDTLDATNATFTDDDGTDYTGYDSRAWYLKTNEDDADADAVVAFKTDGTKTTGKLVLGNGSFYLEADPAVTDGKEGLYY